MKKIILNIIAIMMIFVTVPFVKAEELPKVTDHEKVTIYIFWGNGCPNCTNAINYFHELDSKYDDYLEVKTYEVWYNEDNVNFASEVASLLDHELTGVPFLVVGEEYISGWGENVGKELIDYALEYYQDKNYKDIVKEALKDTKHEVEETSLEDAFQLENVEQNAEQKEEAKGGKYDAIIVVGIFAVLIGGFASLVIFGKKQ